jgi:hypothetical protein
MIIPSAAIGGAKSNFNYKSKSAPGGGSFGGGGVSGQNSAEERMVLTSTPLYAFNPLNAELNPICYLLALLGARHFLHVSRISVKSVTLRQLMSYIYINIWSTYS